VDIYLQFEHGEEVRSITFEGRVRLRVDFNPIGPVVAVEPVDGAVVIEAESEAPPEAVSRRRDGRRGPRPAARGDSALLDGGVLTPSFADGRRRALVRARKGAAAPAVPPPDRAPGARRPRI
jgi:hypothetical protein